jgi:hypothetical protein
MLVVRHIQSHAVCRNVYLSLQDREVAHPALECVRSTGEPGE